MPKCPECKKEVTRPSKKWKYSVFTVELFDCGCGTQFREYSKKGKYSHTLKIKKGRDKNYSKV
jgi:hypothetical protein